MSISNKEKELEKITKEIETLRRVNRGMGVVTDILGTVACITMAVAVTIHYKKSK